MSMQNDGSDPEKLEVPEFTDLHSRFLLKEKDQKPVTRPVEANTDLLARLESFLPEIQKANEDIRCSEKQSTCNEYVLELPEINVASLLCRRHDGECIELDLSCGVFDLKNDTAIEAAEKSVAGVPAPVDMVSRPLPDDSEFGQNGKILSRHPGIQEL